jgi:alkanesulfonate monooxygenase SsuD/methylene tetrahydromethanopterin reductase-like flavin-dependent oxidoreductase (luciferase family)
MAMLALRFDLRNPDVAGVTTAERYQAAIDMAAWAEQHGGISVSLSEHHGSDDGYLPSPLVLATAIAARTSTIRITVAALLAPLYDPVRLAEDLAVIDNASQGRVDVIIGAGYVAGEFESFGVPLSERGKRVTETVELLRQAWTGEPFTFQGRTVRVTPTPFRDSIPLMLGGSSDAAARRAARIGDGYLPVSADSWPAYRDEMLKLGKPDPGPREPFEVVTTFLAADPDKAWDDLLPYFLHETNAYAAWLDAAGADGPYQTRTPQEVRESGQYRVVTPDQYVEELRAMGDFPFAMFHPMVGGVPPKLAWECLRLYEQQVLPALSTSTVR